MIWDKLLGGKTFEQIAGIADKAIVDKDKRAEFLFQVRMIMLNSQIAKYIRAVLAIIVTVSVMFFADRLTIDTETQKYLLYAVFMFYFFDYAKDILPTRKK